VFAIAIMPSLATAAGNNTSPSSTKLQLQNVELNEKGQLVGQVVSETGQPGIAAIVVRSQSDLNKVATHVKTDESGRFVIDGLKGGKCLFTIGTDSFLCQTWAHGTAPPKSLKSVAVVTKSGVVLGQSSFRPTGRIRNSLSAMTGTQKALLVGVVAAAIILPIALSDDDDDDAS